MENNSSQPPIFPKFKPLELEDRGLLQPRLWEYQPETSELTFTNLLIWKDHYKLSWSLDGAWLLIITDSASGGTWSFPPIGPPFRAPICLKLLRWLQGEKGVEASRIERADNRLVQELADTPGFLIEPLRDHFDYVYRSADLIELKGHHYQGQRNHIHQVQRAYAYAYETLQDRHLAACLELAETWCASKRCAEDLSLSGEWEAVKASLQNFHNLQLEGGVILINQQVAAFTLGEMLNQDTAVIHIEKASPQIPGLYAVINQEFSRHSWSQVPFVNREQDLGVPGLRTAKLSYNPLRLVEKFRIQLT